jgi:SAM-dependent methyltransferase
MANGITEASTRESIVFDTNPVRPFKDQNSELGVMSHDCQKNLADFATAQGSSKFSDMVFTIRQCTVCGLGFTYPIPTEETSHLLYETRESNDFQPDDSALVAHLKAISTRRDVRGFVDGLDLPKGPMLDFGCGNAEFAVALQREFPSYQVLGADMQEAPPKALTRAQYRSYPELFKESNQFSLILCRHVLEHSYDPIGLLRSLFDLIMPGGVLIIEVPSLEAKVAKVFGRYWASYYVPYHPIHFTRESLRAAMVAAKFCVIREGTAEMPNIGRSLHNLVGGMYHLGLFALGMLLHPLQIGIGLATNTSVCLRIWARKPVE